MKNTNDCPCGSGNSYRECCRSFHKGLKKAPTAERLMRSRFTAFAKNIATYLIETWHPTTRPAVLDLDKSISWTRLEVLSTHQGLETDNLGWITFTAHYIKDGIPGTFTEASDFIRQSEEWFYLKGTSSK